jgi:hypothetical protein
VKLTRSWQRYIRYGIGDFVLRCIARTRVMIWPSRCSGCNIRIAPTNSPEYRIAYGHDHYPRVHAAVSAFGQPFCRSCLAKRVSALFGLLSKTETRRIMRATDYTLNRRCDSCESVRPTIRIGTSEGPAPCDIRISVDWWNGFHVCEDCITTVVKYGKLSTGVYGTRRAIFSNKLISYVVCHNDVHQQIYLDPADRLLQPLKD